MTLTRNDVELLIQNEILPRTSWKDPTQGKSGTDIQGKIDQLISRFPFHPISSAALEVPWVTNSSTDLFLASGGVFVDGGVDIVFDALQSFSMNSIATTLQIPSLALGVDIQPEKLEEFQFIFSQILRRFLSVALIYGGYNNSGWSYYDSWDQSISFSGMQELCEGGIGYKHTSTTSFTLQNLNSFLRTFRGANEAGISCLVMNLQLREKYLNLWHGIPQLPQYITDPISGRLCLAHDGIPIITNDYILTYINGTDPASHPENVGVGTFDKTSVYAVVLGEENQGAFGIFPSAFGTSPLKIERQRSLETGDTVFLRGMIEAGLATKTTRSIGRWAGIDMT